MRTLELDQQHNGQWRYRVSETFDNETKIIVDWQWGPDSEEEALKQATERFGPFSKVVIEDWI